MKDDFDEIVVLSRSPSVVKESHRVVQWDAETLDDWTAELEGSSAVINLTGKSIQCRFTAETNGCCGTHASRALRYLEKPSRIVNALPGLDQCFWCFHLSSDIYRRMHGGVSGSRHWLSCSVECCLGRSDPNNSHTIDPKSHHSDLSRARLEGWVSSSSDSPKPIWTRWEGW